MAAFELKWTDEDAHCPHCQQRWPKWRLERACDRFGESHCVVSFCDPNCPHMMFCAPLTDAAEAKITGDLKFATQSAAADIARV